MPPCVRVLPMLNDTISRFGYPETLLAEYDHWVVLLRHQQVTAGSMVLACKGDARRLPEVSAEAFAQLPEVSAELEESLRHVFSFDKINYLLLMMVDPHVHFHVIPRYADPRVACGVTFEDRGWPGAPVMGHSTSMTDEQFAALRDLLRSSWPR